MKVIILTAGLGTRLRPHTYSKPKPLLSVAGKPVLAHIIDYLSEIRIDELICVTGYLGNQIEAYVREHYDFPMRFLVQEVARGQADAIGLAREMVDGPLLVVFGDGLFSLDKERLNQHPSEGIIYCKEVDDPRRFGVAVVEEGRITRLVEKPSEPVSNLAVIGAYYVPEARRLMGAISAIMERGIQTKGEYYLADALQVMLEQGEIIHPETVSMWRDCGTVDALLDTNRYLLENGMALQPEGTLVNSVVIPPVRIDPTARIENAVVGPYASIGAGAVVRDAIIKDSIINDDAQVEDVSLAQSLVGARTRVAGSSYELNIGDQSYLKVR
jgi:glucose-1-phosphate thymidylyltransferase